MLEFLGCHFHSCPKCYGPQDINPVTGKLRKFEHEHTMKRLEAIRDQGYNMITMRECEFQKLMEEDQGVKEYMSKAILSTPLTPFQALFGGRTNAIRTHYECSEDEEIKVLDFTSLYPWVSTEIHRS